MSIPAFECAANPSFPEGHVAKRPVLFVDVVNGAESYSCYAIVDSGADHCTFPLSLAMQIGLDPLTAVASTTKGVGDSAVATFYWPVRINIQGIATLDAYAAFTAGLEGVGFGLLGQAGFFDRVRVVFDHNGGLFHLGMPDAAEQ